jgi:hypothetical protein
MRRVLTCLTAAVIASAGLAIIAPAASAADSGTFSVLSYNVAGIPLGLDSAETKDRQAATTAIGQRLGTYDIVHVQEDFNFHAALYAADSHPYRTPTSGGALFGSGLNSLSNNAYDEGDFERVKWNSCQYDSGDCLTPKGFTFMRVRLAEGVYVDYYNLHTNAGTSDGDLKSRADNLAQLSSFIKSHSAGNAVVVMGDTNTRYTRTEDTIAAFVADHGLTDAWVRLVRGGTAPEKGGSVPCDAHTAACEVVDKILYRGSKLVSLNATAYRNDHDAFLEDGTGLMLSDHDPIAARFSWSKNADFRLSEQTGGPHGDYFNDIDRVPAGAQTTAVSLRAGDRLDQVGVTLNNGATLTHGGTGGTYSSLTMRAGEYPTTAYLCSNKENGHTRVFYARFTTNLGRTLAGGSTTPDCRTVTAPSGWHISGFHGRAADEVDKLGFIYTPNGSFTADREATLVNRATGKCLDVNEASAADGAIVQLWTCNAGLNQRWRVAVLADGTGRLVSLGSGKALDNENCGTADGTAIRQWSWLDNPCQRWTFPVTDSGWVRLENPHSGKVADVANCGSADGTGVRLWSWLNNHCQQWQVKS